MKKYLHTLCLLNLLGACIMSTPLSAQQFSAGINTDNPNPNAVLHLISPNGDQGLLIPNLTTTQRGAMILDVDDVGLLVYDADIDEFFFWDGSAWTSLANTDEQNLTEVLGNGADAGGVAITNVADPIDPQDVATKNYVDNLTPASASPWTGSPNISYSGGFVGIGTATPVTDMHIFNTADQAKALTIDAQGTQASQLAAMVLATLGDGASILTDPATNGWLLGAYGDAFSDAGRQNDLTFSYYNGVNETSSVLHLDAANGNVGIGTGNPLAPLQVGDNLTIFHYNNGGTTVGEAFASNLYPAGTSIEYANNGHASIVFLEEGNVSFLSTGATAGTAGNDATVDVVSLMKLDSLGNADLRGAIQVGNLQGGVAEEEGMVRWTGTDLEVNTNGTAGGWSSLTGGLTLPYNQTNANTTDLFAITQTDATAGGGKGVAVFSINDATGTNNTSPAMTAHTNVAAGLAGYFTNSAGGSALELVGDLAFEENASGIIRVLAPATGGGNNLDLFAASAAGTSNANGGNITLNPGMGDGTGFPGIVEVNGNMRILDGSEQAGYVLTSDASGNASWQPSSLIGLNSNISFLSGAARSIGINAAGTGDNLSVFAGGSTAGNAGNLILRGGNATGGIGGEVSIQAGAGTTNGPITLQTGGGVVRLSGNGSLGVGTNIPRRAFHLDGATGGISFQMTNSASGNTSPNAGFVIDYNDIGEEVDFFHYGGSSVRFRDGTDIALTIDNANNRIGVGVIAPTAALDVNGNAAISGSLDINTTANVTNELTTGTLISTPQIIDSDGLGGTLVANRRTIVLTGTGTVNTINSVVDGKELLIVGGATSAPVIASSGNIRLNSGLGDFNMTDGSSIQLVYIANLNTWVELSRTP